MKNSEYFRLKELVDDHILDFLTEVDPKSITLFDSITYSLKAGGKRVRPTLLLAACNFSGGNEQIALPYACAIEYLHTYSLIHDDLPAMDDDDLRRGQATNHKVYGEAMAILAGDALLTTAFEVMTKDMLLYFDDMEKVKCRVRATYEIAKEAGCKGLLSGQAADIEAEVKQCSKEMLDYIHMNKTGALIVAAIRAGAFLGGANDKTLKDLTEYAENLGLAFQIADDILDVVGDKKELGKNVGVDKEKCKSTYPTLYGLEASKERLMDLTESAINALADYYDNAEYFVDIAKELAKRVN